METEKKENSAGKYLFIEYYNLTKIKRMLVMEKDRKTVNIRK